MQKDSVSIALLWHAPNSGNLGVGALTIGNIALLQRAAAQAGRALEFKIIGWVDQTPFYPQVQDIPVVALTARKILEPSGYAQAIRNCDIVIDIGAGDSFSDIVGMKRFAYLAATKAIALACKRPLVLAPQTLGPYYSPFARRIAEWLIRSSAAVFARDEQSSVSVRDPKALEKIRVTADVAFALPFERMSKSSDRVRVGLNASAVLYHGGYSGTNQFGLTIDYPQLIKRLVENFLSRSEVELVLVPHVIAPHMPVEDDLALSRSIAAEYGLPEPQHFTDPVMAKSYISSCDLLVGARMHACIAAVSTGVATAPIAYSRKFAGLFGGIGYDRTIDGRTVNTDDAFQAVLRIYDDRKAAACEAQSAAQRANEKLAAYVDALVPLLKDA